MIWAALAILAVGASSAAAEPRPESYPILYPGIEAEPLQITGRVVDAKTGEPIPHAKVAPGFETGVDNGVSQRHLLQSVAQDGTFSIALTGVHRFHDRQFVRVEGAGYRSTRSAILQADDLRREQPGEAVNITLELQRAEPVKVQVLLPSGQPAEDAFVAIGSKSSRVIVATGMPLTIEGQAPSFQGKPYQPLVATKTDEAGFTTLPAEDHVPFVVALHPAGWASAPAEADVVLELEPWAALGGTIQRNGKPFVNARYEAEQTPPTPAPVSQFRMLSGMSQTNEAGEFVIWRMAGGGASLEIGTGFWNRDVFRIRSLEPGEQRRVDLNREGIPTTIWFIGDPTGVAGTVRSTGQVRRSLTLGDDGVANLGHLPAGRWELFLMNTGPNRTRSGPESSFHFDIEEDEESVRLGPLALYSVEPVAAGTAIDIGFDFPKGYRVLHLWPVRHPVPDALLMTLRRAQDRLRDSPDVALAETQFVTVVTLGEDDLALLREARQQVPWPVVTVGDPARLVEQLAVTAEHQVAVLDPDGKLVAADVKMNDVLVTIHKDHIKRQEKQHEQNDAR